jgi:eukaryotic-like serine/threonine-protein kinase
VVNLPKGKVARFGDGGWLDDARIVFNGTEEGAKGARVFLQSIPDGLPSPITPEGITLPIKAPTPDGRSILVRTAAGFQITPVGEGPSRPVPGLKRGDQPLQWSSEGKFLYVASRATARPASLDVFRVDVATGDRVLWKTLAPTDPIGVDNISAVAITPDATAYCYSHLRRLGDLFVVSGLK